MTSEDELLLPEATAWISREEALAICGLDLDELTVLVEHGVLAVEIASAHWRIAASELTTLRRAGRLRRDFELDPTALALALSLLSRIDALERELHGLGARAG